MALNAGIILGGQPVNILGAMNEGRAMAESQIAMNRQNALAELYRTQGAGIAAGDQNALNALAGMDPGAALGIQDTRLGMDQTRLGMDATRLGMDATRQNMAISAEELQIRRDESKREAEAALREQSDKLTAAQLAAEQAELERGIAAASTATTPEEWDRIATQFGVPQLVGQFADKDAVVASALGIVDAMKTFAPPEAPKPLSSPGKVAADIEAGFLPEGTPLSSPSTVVNTGDGAPSDSKLRGKLMEKEGELWAQHLTTGAVSAGTVQDMAALDELIKIAPQGPVTGRMAEVFPGFSSAGDAFQSIVKRVAPTLRAPGSGATSDIEYDGMLRSLPALRNTPEANRAIAEMMKAKARLNVERANVIGRYQNGEIEAPEARAEMARLDSISIMTPEAARALGLTGSEAAAPATNKSPTEMSDEEFLRSLGIE